MNPAAPLLNPFGLSSFIIISYPAKSNFSNLVTTPLKLFTTFLNIVAFAFIFSGSFSLPTPVIESDILEALSDPNQPPRNPPTTVPTPGNIAVPIAAPRVAPAIPPPTPLTAPEIA